jgi:hypothetical protein
MTMRKTLSATILAVLALAAGAQAASNKSCTGLVVSPDGDPGHGKASFSVTSETGLSFLLVVPPSAQVDAQDLVTIRLTTPNGHPYETLDLPVAPAGSKETQRQVHGYPLPVPVHAFASTNFRGKGAQHVFGTIPLAGSLIESFSLYGRWTAEAQLGTGAPCSASFTIVP